MLEIKHVSKTYCPKKGVPVKALDDVSLKFEDRGMVFILGKSGSGKSTLLNVLGGLDKADSGEFIIKGKSSNDFTQSDFDSYRNTFIGFIFQEYNILPEFTVGANIALAMELQGKKASDDALNEILEEVDLVGYGNRKPNELSGGQKQRVAIARALIKEPEMIMADEPTGALDSNTGKQVFDTLKKLSEKKLVLIVSHDRDFAELYADRIIELKDGKIISDVSKTSLAPNSLSEGVSVVDDKVIRIKKGYKLTNKDLDLINGYLSRGGDDDTLISFDGKKNVEIKKALKINEEGGKDEFLDTKPEDVKTREYTKEESKLIRSKLPYRNSLKIGASGLKSKPVRLVFTILLCMVAFTLFGLADTMAAYNKFTTYEQSIIDTQIQGAAFTKAKRVKSDWDENYYYTNSALFNDNDIKKVKDGSGVNVTPVYVNGERGNATINLSNSMTDTDKLDSENSFSFYTGEAAGYVEMTQEDLGKAGLTLVENSRLPEKEGEIAVTQYIYEMYKLAGLQYVDPNTEKTVNAEIKSVSDLLGKPLTFTDRYSSENSKTYSIVGVIDTHFDSSKFDDYKPDAQKKEPNMLTDMLLSSELSVKLTYSYHNLLFVYPGTIAKMVELKQTNVTTVATGKYLDRSSFNMQSEKNNDYTSFYANFVAKLSDIKDKDAIVWTDGTPKTTLAKNEVIVPYTISYENDRAIKAETEQWFTEQFGETYTNWAEDNSGGLTLVNIIYSFPEWAIRKEVEQAKAWKTNSALETFLLDFGDWENNKYQYCEWNDGDYVETEESKNKFFVDKYTEYLRNMSSYDYRTEKSVKCGLAENPYGDSGLIIMRPYLKRFYELENIKNKVPETGNIYMYNDAEGKSVYDETYTIVGYLLPSADMVVHSGDNYSLEIRENNYAVVSDENYNFYSGERGYYSFVIGNMPYNDHAAVAKIVKFNYDIHDGDVLYELQNEVSMMIDNVNGLVETLSQVFLYIGIGFAVFAALMLFNFISVSISYKKREIGILRAVGARSSDVFGIFFNESMIITIINFVLSSVVTFIVVNVINNVIRNQYGFALTLLTIGIRQFALILAVGVLVAFVASFLPVMRIAKKRPIDAIQNR